MKVFVLLVVLCMKESKELYCKSQVVESYLDKKECEKRALKLKVKKDACVVRDAHILEMK